MRKKLAIITTHPVQYNAPLFRKLAAEESIELKVFYTGGEQALKKFDPGFGKIIEWNIPLLKGYDHVFVANRAKKPGSHHFSGISNPALVRELEAWDPAAILVYGWAFRSHLQVLRHFRGKRPLFFRGDSTVLDRQPVVKRWLRAIVLRWVYRTVDVALYTGTHNKAYFLAHGIKIGQLAYMPHAVDNDRFLQGARAAEAGKGEWRSRHGLSANDLLFLYAGKLVGKKNVELLIDAFQRAGLNNTCLVIAGNGPLEEGLKKRAGNKPNIRFLPFQNQAEMPMVLAAADVVVLPSKVEETWGLVVNEAMACAKPVLVSEACGCACDLVEPGVNGYIFRNNDGADLAAKLRTLAGNRKGLAEMGIRSEEKIRHWSYRQNVDILRNLVERV